MPFDGYDPFNQIQLNPGGLNMARDMSGMHQEPMELPGQGELSSGDMLVNVPEAKGIQMSDQQRQVWENQMTPQDRLRAAQDMQKAAQPQRESQPGLLGSMGFGDWMQLAGLAGTIGGMVAERTKKQYSPMGNIRRW